jgi:hypothetical protein
MEPSPFARRFAIFTPFRWHNTVFRHRYYTRFQHKLTAFYCEYSVNFVQIKPPGRLQRNLPGGFLSDMSDIFLAPTIGHIGNGLPSLIRRVCRISFGITTRPRLSSRRTMPLAFITVLLFCLDLVSECSISQFLQIMWKFSSRPPWL